MKLSLFFVFAFVTTSAVGQYYMFETKLTCASDRGDILKAGHRKITEIMNTMVSEGALLNFSTRLENKKGSSILHYTSTAQNEGDFSKFTKEWKKRTVDLDPKLFEAFWKACPIEIDTMMNKTQLLYPYIKGDINSPVAVVEGIDEKPDSNLIYNLVFDFTAYTEIGEKGSKMDSSKVNWGLSDLGRLYNLHIAAGIPKERINFVVAIHGGNASRTFFNNQAYQKKYKIDNPNLSRIEELSNAGVKFLMCGQSLTWFGYNKTMLSPKAKVTLTAQTTLSSYQVKGYALKSMAND